MTKVKVDKEETTDEIRAEVVFALNKARKHGLVPEIISEALQGVRDGNTVALAFHQALSKHDLI